MKKWLEHQLDCFYRRREAWMRKVGPAYLFADLIFFIVLLILLRAMEGR